MNYETYKAVEEYFKLGEVIENDFKKLNALNRIKQGLVSLNDLSLLQNEICSLGCSGSDSIEICELYEALVDEINQLKEAREDLKKIAASFSIDIHQIDLQKYLYDFEIMTKGKI